RTEHYTWSDRTGDHQSSYWKWAIAVASPSQELTDAEPTAVTGGERSPLAGVDHEDLVGSLALIYPHDAEHFLVGTIDSVIRASTSTEVSHDAVRVLSAITRHPGRLGSLALTTLVAGLTASKTDQRAYAVDALLQHQRHGALDGDALARGIMSMN